MKIAPVIRFASWSLLPLLIALQGARALDFTPIFSFREVDGVKIPVIQFDDEGTKISYKPPADWHPSGSGGTLCIYAPGIGDSWMKLVVVGKKTPETPAAASVSGEELQAFARRFIPPGSKNIAFVKQGNNSFTLEGHASAEFIFTFSLYGNRDIASISLVDRSETTWMVMLVSSNTRDFGSIREQAISSMFSWRRVE